MRLLHIGLASPVMAMEGFLEKHRTWIEAVVGCATAETITLECNFPFSHLVLEQMLAEVNLDRQCLGSAETLRPLVRHWETPPECSPRIELIASRDRRALVTERRLAWDPHWKETPIAVWLHSAQHAIVTVNIPYVSYIEKGALSWKQWTIVNRREAALCLRLLREVERPRNITVIGGHDIPLPESGYNWDSVLLDPSLNEMVRDDYETFWDSEAWFHSRNLPYKRGFLLYGPPGNGKTTAARIMACHPQVSAFSIELKEQLPNEALSDLFQAAEDRAPALIILEDLDRTFGSLAEAKRTEITVSHLLNCLDGIGVTNGIVVVATANDPATLDQAILRRPGRFDRLVPFLPPPTELRRQYLQRLTDGTLDERSALQVAREADGLSFAQLQEAYILAGQRAFRRSAGIGAEELTEAVRTIRNEVNGLISRGNGRFVGFGGPAPTESLSQR